MQKAESPDRFIYPLQVDAGTGHTRGGERNSATPESLHYVVALGAAGSDYWASRFMPAMSGRAWTCGVIYGALTHLFMNFVVIPLAQTGAVTMPFRLKTARGRSRR
jgi:hypothetical protein